MESKLDFGLKGKSRDSDLGLVSTFPLASIQSDAHLAEVQEVISASAVWKMSRHNHTIHRATARSNAGSRP